MQQNQCAFRWTPGKFVIIDNDVTYHAREPYIGKRRVYATMGKGVKPVAENETHLVLSSGDKLP